MRSSGILMHITSLPSPYGIGTLGRDAYEFVGFLRAAKQKYWQILPLNPTGFGNSPYQSFSAFAGNPYMIDLDLLCEDGLLEKEEFEHIDWGSNPEKVDFGKIYIHRSEVLRTACSRFQKNDEFTEFCAENSFWLDGYVLFMSLKNSLGGKPWYQWPQGLKMRNEQAIEGVKSLLTEEMDYHKTVQFLFYRQWKNLKKYAKENEISIIGDLPIYVAHDSADVWGNPGQFLLDGDYNPSLVAGVPPDGFSKEGQLWGNPVFDWEYMRKDGYRWWIRRLEHSMTLFDRLRIDHFRGFSSYYAVPYGMKNAVSGLWYKGPGIEFFKAVETFIGKADIIAEDLGYTDYGVINLLKETGFPGMKVLQFAFDRRENSDHLPHNYEKNCVVYIGTHDNDTLCGWFENADSEDIAFAESYLRLNEAEGRCIGVIKSALASVGETAILTMQDLLCLGTWARMNTPSTAENNWQWRALKEDINAELAERIAELTKLYKRAE